MKHLEQETEMTYQKGRIANFYPEGFYLIEDVEALERTFLEMLRERLEKDYYQPPHLPPEAFPYDINEVNGWPKAVRIHALNYITDYERMKLRYEAWVAWIEEARAAVAANNGEQAYEIMSKWTQVCGCDPTFTIVIAEQL